MRAICIVNYTIASKFIIIVIKIVGNNMKKYTKFIDFKKEILSNKQTIKIDKESRDSGFFIFKRY